MHTFFVPQRFVKPSSKHDFAVFDESDKSLKMEKKNFFDKFRNSSRQQFLTPSGFTTFFSVALLNK
jgi:hypothetical protein